jgi:hypothetical protein
MIASLGVILLWGMQHLLGRADAQVDQFALFAFGILLGQLGAHTDAVQTAANKINGMESKVNELASAQGIAPIAHMGE